MKFPADEIHLVRLGEKTRLTIPYDRRPSPFKEAGYYVLERLIDVATRKPCRFCDQTGKRKDGLLCGHCKGHGDRVHYSTKVERIESEERIQVHTVEKIHPEDLTDDQALQEGYESAEEWRDVFFATYGESEWVWTYSFELTTQVPQYMALQQGIKDAPQYVSTPSRALDDADSPTADEYRGWAEHAEAERRRQREIERLEQRRHDLAEKIDQLKRKAA